MTKDAAGTPPPQTDADVAAHAPPRALALDTLRGLAILLMCLSGIVPEALPNFMYHGYYPRFLPDADGVWSAVPDPHTFRPDWPSFTWVDWVFPMFLFSMGAAIPLALHRRRQRGATSLSLVTHVVQRWLWLIAFAVYVRQITPAFVEHPTSLATWALGLLGFALLFPVLMRMPMRWNPRWRWGVRVGGIAVCVGLVASLNHRAGRAFSWADHDIIILLLAHMSIAASLLWLVTRRRPWARLAALVLVFVAHDRAIRGGWAWLDPVFSLPNLLLDFTWLRTWLPVLWPGLIDLSVLLDLTWFKFLFVVIPGTVVGDLLLDLNRESRAHEPSEDNNQNKAWSTARLLALAAVMTAVILAVLVGLRNHGSVVFEAGSLRLITPWATWVGVLPLLIGGFLLTRHATTHNETFLRKLLLWGAVWLLLGLLAEPFEGGISKGPPSTLSYYLVSLAGSILLLAVLFIVTDVLNVRRAMALFVLNGQNPMLAYVGIRNLLAPVVNMRLFTVSADAGAESANASLNHLASDLLPDEPWYQLIWALVQTLALALVVTVLTRLRVVWRV